MKKRWIGACLITAVVFGAVIVASAYAEDDDHDVWAGTIQVTNQPETAFPGLAKVGPVQAGMNATGKVEGEILKVGLEEENSFLVYDVEVVTPEKTIMNVKVDAGSGEVLSVKKDDADRDADNRDEDRENHDREYDD